MHLFLVMVVCLALFLDEAGTAVARPGWSAACTWLGVAVAGAMAELSARWFARRIRAPAGVRAQTLRRYNQCRFAHLILILGLYLLGLYRFDGLGIGWVGVVRGNLGLHDVVLLDELLLLAPLLASFLLGWLAFHRVERALHETSSAPGETAFWTRPAYVLFHIRQYLGLVLAPILLFTTARELVLWLLPGRIDWFWFELGSTGFMLLMILVLMPWLLTVIWCTQTLPPGPLRDRLEAAARRLGFRCTDIRLWNTRGDLANAMVTGLLPFPRYVLLSDGLIGHLRPEEIEAVFGHEVGHVKHRHMPLYLGFLFLSMIGIMGLLSRIDPGRWTYLQLGGQAMVLVVLGGYIWLVFGFLSRRCERQADLYGCKAVSCSRAHCEVHEAGPLPSEPLGERPGGQLELCPTGIRTFIGALEKVASLNGIERSKPSWQHSSIARRVAFLEEVLRDPDRERHFQRRLGLVKLALLAVLVAAVALQWDVLRDWFQPGP